MIVYSNVIIRFVSEIKAAIKNIISSEVRLKVFKERFYDLQQNYSYPITPVIYNNKNMLGYFDPEFFELGFHECLMHANRDLLHNVIRHELAHYLSVIKYGKWVRAHGYEYRECCKRYGWGEEVYRATTCLDEGVNIYNIQESSIFRKVQKLMALASSSNQNEAEQAMIKSQQLLLKHNIESKYIGSDDEEKLYLKRILKQKKQDAKMNSIGSILKTFFVNVIYKRADDCTYLEILGSAVNVEIAEYIAVVLQRELDVLWEQAMTKYVHLKGLVAKNSFFFGIAKGYCEKVNALKRGYNNETSQALMVIEKKLIDAQSLVYKSLRSSKSSGSFCRASSELGEIMGRQLNLNPGLAQSANNSNSFLEFQK